MKLKHISIQRQIDDSFAVVAKVEYSSGSTVEVILMKGEPGKKASTLKDDLLFYLSDEESLQAEILYQLREAS
jgi:hypothetical protein